MQSELRLTHSNALNSEIEVSVANENRSAISWSLLHQIAQWTWVIQGGTKARI